MGWEIPTLNWFQFHIFSDSVAGYESLVETFCSSLSFFHHWACWFFFVIDSCLVWMWSEWNCLHFSLQPVGSCSWPWIRSRRRWKSQKNVCEMKGKIHWKNSWKHWKFCWRWRHKIFLSLQWIQSISIQLWFSFVDLSSFNFFMMEILQT